MNEKCRECQRKTDKGGHMTRKSAIAIEIISGPDNRGRYAYATHWYDPTPPYCGVCGADPSRNCGHYGPRTRGQIFRSTLKHKETS